MRSLVKSTTEVLVPPDLHRVVQAALNRQQTPTTTHHAGVTAARVYL
jgi:hypothetical protein